MICAGCGVDFTPARLRPWTKCCSRACSRSLGHRTRSERARDFAATTERFFTHVDRTVDGCWEFQARHSVDGYRCFTFSRRQWLAHRVSWLIHNGPIPDGLLVLHHCDNRKCVRPDHLFLGTNKDNSDDKHSKGRARYALGERSAHAKLTADSVREMRSLFSIGDVTIKALSQTYGVTPRAARMVVLRESWRHV